jgi:Dictyostelium (slime mold) repeat
MRFSLVAPRLAVASIFIAATLINACYLDSDSLKGGRTACSKALECDDKDVCTVDECKSGGCVHTPAADGVAPEQVTGDCKSAACANGHEFGLPNDSDLPDDSNDCTKDGCSEGIPTYTAVPTGTTCSSNGGVVCSGGITPACVQCFSASDCTSLPPDDECRSRTCLSGVCGQTFAPAGTPLATQSVGDCHVEVCDGKGAKHQDVDDTDVPNDGNDCTADKCANGQPSNPFQPQNAPCGGSAGLYCDGAGQCAGCTDASQCGPPLPCQNRTCVTGECGLANKSNGTSCDDGVFCNGADTCAAGVCSNHAGDPCAGNVGDGDGDCSESCNEAANDCSAPDPTGSACSSGNNGPCKIQDTCDGSANCATTYQPSSTQCSASAEHGCVLAAKCTGSSAACPAAQFATVNTACNQTYDCDSGGCYTNSWGCSATGTCTVLLSSVFSCPILYSWDGQDFAFESDMYTSGTLGLWLSNHYRKPDPNDAYVLRQPLTEKNGLFDLRLVEELEEIDYLDEARLFAVDVPNGRQVVAWANNVPGPAVALDQRLVSIGLTHKKLGSAVHLETGEDVAAAIAASDSKVVTLSEDNNKPYWNTIEIDPGDLSGSSVIKLVVDGRSRYPTTAAGFAYRAQQDPKALQTNLQVLDANNNWVDVPRTLVILVRPKEFPRVMAADITNIFLTNDYRMRLSWVNKTALDAIWVDTAPNEPLTISEAPLASATLGYHGFSSFSAGDLPVYNYALPGALSWPLAPGSYTHYGEVSPLLGTVDDMFAIFGSGDEVALEFLPPAAPATGAQRFYAFASVGYYKQSNLVNGGLVPYTVSPLPFAAMSNFPYGAPEAYPTDTVHQNYLSTWNTRTIP